MRATRLSVANYNTTLSSNSLESGTGSSNSLRSTGPAPAPPHFRGQCSARYTVIPNFNFHFFSLSRRHHSVCQTAFRV